MPVFLLFIRLKSNGPESKNYNNDGPNHNVIDMVVEIMKSIRLHCDVIK